MSPEDFEDALEELREALGAGEPGALETGAGEPGAGELVGGGPEGERPTPTLPFEDEPAL